MKDSRLKVGIAGYGVVGKRRRQYIDLNPHLETVAVCDQAFGEDVADDEGVKCFSHYSQLVEEPLDVLFVSLPNYMAPEVTIAGLDRGMHVFCEKPPGRNVADVESVRSTKEKHPDLLLKYGFNHRYHDSVREALRIVRSGELGELVNMRGVYGKSGIVAFPGSWRAERKYSGGGILLDQGIHMVDLMRLFCGEFVEAKSYISNGYWDCDVEDNAYALIRDAKGRVAMLHSSATQWQHRFALEIAMTQGYLELRGILSGSKSYGEERLIVGRRDDSATGTHHEEIFNYLEDNSWRDEINDFASAIVNGKEVQSGTVEEAVATMRLVYRIYAADPDWKAAYDLDAPD
ncbi:Gfo/Idh/MocA family protein [Verrucomicrobiota bacterium]